MPKYKFKNVGIRMLESEHGDILICDSNLNFDTIIVKEVIERAKRDDKMASMLGRQIVNFVVKQREARLKIAVARIDVIAKVNPEKARLLNQYVEENNLRKVEKDVYFFFKNNPDAKEIEEVEERQTL